MTSNKPQIRHVYRNQTAL